MTTNTTINKQNLGLAKTNNKQRITLFVNPSILKHARAQAVVDEISLTSLVERALIAYLPKETVIKKTYIKEDSDT